MASIVTLPRAPDNALGNLGQIIFGAANDYAQNKRADDREARLRAQRLADVADERAYAKGENDRTYARVRTDRLADVTSDREFSEREKNDAMARELVRLGYLSPTDIRNQSAITAAYARVQADGEARKYEDALKTGDLTFADLGDAERVAAGLERFSARLAQRTTDQEAGMQGARTRLGQLAAERDALSRDAATLAGRLNDPEPMPSREAVQARALQLAQATKKPGQRPSTAEIAAMIGQATEEIAGQLALRWNQQRQDALVQRQLINDRLRDVSAEINTLTNRFGVVGAASAGAPSPAPAGAATPPRTQPDLGAAQKAFAETLMAQLGQRGGAPTAAPSPAAQPQAATPAPGPAANLNDPYDPAARAARSAEMRRLNPPSDLLADLKAALPNTIFSAGVVPKVPPMAAPGTGLPPEQELQQLESLWARVGDQRAPAAQKLAARIDQLRRSLAQASSAVNRLSEPVNTPLESAPRPSVRPAFDY